MKKFRTIVVDDEPLASQYLVNKLKKFTQIDVITTCKNGREALQAIDNQCPDIIFMDIEMPGLNGLEVASKIQTKNTPIIVFTTAFEQYALNAFDVNASDYLLKPINEERLKLAINKSCINHFAINHSDPIKKSQKEPTLTNFNYSENKKHFKKVVIKDRDKIHLINQSDIEWVDAAGDYVCVHANGDTHVKRSTLKEIEDELNPDLFKRIHRSTIVNLNYINKAIPLNKGEYFLQIGEHQQLKVSRNYKDCIRNYLQQ